MLAECSSVAEWITGSSVFIIWKLTDIGLWLGLSFEAILLLSGNDSFHLTMALANYNIDLHIDMWDT